MRRKDSGEQKLSRLHHNRPDSTGEFGRPFGTFTGKSQARDHMGPAMDLGNLDTNGYRIPHPSTHPQCHRSTSKRATQKQWLSMTTVPRTYMATKSIQMKIKQLQSLHFSFKSALNFQEACAMPFPRPNWNAVRLRNGAALKAPSRV